MVMHRADCQAGIVVMVQMDRPLEEGMREQTWIDVERHDGHWRVFINWRMAVPAQPILLANVLFAYLTALDRGELGILSRKSHHRFLLLSPTTESLQQSRTIVKKIIVTMGG